MARCNFTCIDCGVNTSKIDEYYMLKTSIWKRILPSIKGMLCIGCAERRLGRKLRPSDFADVPLNRPNDQRACGIDRSPRLLDRLGYS